MTDIKLAPDKKIYFTSDQHFGAPTPEFSFPREQKFVAWLDEIKTDAQVLFILGDLFDFWFEYKTVVPKGFVRVLGKLAELSDRGVKIYFFTGNHDLWVNNYFQEELDFTVFYDCQEFYIGNKMFFIGHGDGKGPGDKGYKRMKKVFTNRFAKALFRWLHPDIGMRLGHYFSVKNKLISGKEDVVFLGEDKEWLAIYAQRKLEKKYYDYFIFGHRHLPMVISLSKNSKYINLGDWINHFSYGIFDGKDFELIKY